MTAFPVCLERIRVALILAAAASLSACGGGGDGDGSGGSPQPTPQPTVTLSANPTTITAGQTSTLTWSSTNATSCTASQGWSGAKSTSGNEQVGPLSANTTFTLACTGSGGTGTQSTTVTVNPAAGTVVVSGRITFERVNFNATLNTGLNINSPVVAPARQVVVEAINPTTRARIGTAVTTDADGNYSLTVPQSTSMLISARAEMVKTGTAPTWNFRVLNNTNSSALYVLDGATFNSGTANSTRDLLADSGWSGTTYVDANRAAAAFAILDTVYKSKELILSATPSATFQALNLFWSPANNATAGQFCTTTGDIGTTFFSPGGQNAGNCTPTGALAAGIYILGNYAGGNGDTDEYDQHVIAHEFGHYVENVFSRSDTIGGSHSLDDRMDLRVAFGEGWGNSYSAMTLSEPSYRDSFRGVSQDFGFNLETGSALVQGWFSESSVGEILWDLYDGAADGADQVQLGFTPIFSVMTGPQRNTDAFTSIFSFADALRDANPTQMSAINALLSAESISGTGEFGDGETNAGGSSTALPIYQDIASGQQILVCGSGIDPDRNKLGYRRFLRLNLASAAVLTITATGAAGPAGSVAATDPDIFVHKRGVVVQFGDATGPTEMISQKPFSAGMHIIEVYDFALSGTATTPHCMNVSVQG